MSHGGFIFNDCRLGETFLHKTRKPSADGSGLETPSPKEQYKKSKNSKSCCQAYAIKQLLKGKQQVVFSLKSFNFIGRQTGIFNNLVHGLTISLHGTGQLYGGGGFAFCYSNSFTFGASLLKASLKT